MLKLYDVSTVNVFSKIFSLIGNLKILKLLKLLIVSNIQYNVFKISYEVASTFKIYILYCPIVKLVKLIKLVLGINFSRYALS